MIGRGKDGAACEATQVRILIVSQMYPGPDDPDLGVFVAQMEEALRDRGHELARAVVDRRGGGRGRHARLVSDARAAARSFRPDVVYAHFLVPAGLAAALATRAPLVVTAHGQDVANVGRIPGVRTATSYVVRRAAAVIAVSSWLRGELERKVGAARGKVEVVDCGVDLRLFPVQPAPPGPPAFVCVGSLTERKNPLRLAHAFERLGEGTLTFVGDGPLRPHLEERPGISVTGRVQHDEIPARLAAARVVCGPSLAEPFGQALLEGMAAGRPVVATRVGGPPEFVTPESGVLVDPASETSILDGLRAALELPCPNDAAREAAAAHDVRLQAERVEEILRRAARDRQA
jgi:glycosyltransferase involved in cell wall biosynthesis